MLLSGIVTIIFSSNLKHLFLWMPASIYWDGWVGIVTFLSAIGIILLTISGLKRLKKSEKVSDELQELKDKVEPLTFLKMRLAKGEITKEEFDKIKEDLKD